MRVLVADPPAKGTRLDDSYPNLGALYLISSLKSALGPGDLDVVYLGPKHDLESHVAFVREYRPDVYAISYTSKAPVVAHRTMRAVREALSETYIVAGGCHPTALPMHVFEDSPADVVGISEGEVTFAEVVKAIASKSTPDFESVKGIYFRRDGEIVSTGLRPFIEDIDTIPFPAWEQVDFRQYPGMHLKRQPIESSLLTSRGCPFSCTFCSQPIWKSQKPWLRVRSLENICEEIELLYARGVREMYLSSDEMNFREDWAVRLGEAIIRLNHPDLFFQANMRADKFSRPLAEVLARMNCWMVHLGVESANDRVLQGIGKNVTVAQIENATRLLSSVGVKVFAFMMLYQAWEENGKLCFETTDEVSNSLRWAYRMFRQHNIHYMSWQFCTPMPGARLSQIAQRHDIYRGDPSQVWKAFDEHQIGMRLPGISARTMKWQIKKGVILKDWFMVRSGGIDARHIRRVWENARALLR